MDGFLKIFENISSFDLIYIVFTILSLIKCSRKGFVLSLIAASKWLLAYVLTLIIFPKVKPFVEGIIDSEYVLDIILGIGIFVIIIFLILMINKGIGKAVTYSGLGTLDKILGFFFGFRFILKRNAAIRFRWHKQVLKIPVFGEMILKSLLARISLILGKV